MWTKICLILISAACFFEAHSQHIYPEESNEFPGYEALGRWDVDIYQEGIDNKAASWLQIENSGYGTLVGSFVGQQGSSRPISIINFSEFDKEYNFSIPTQWSKPKGMISVFFRMVNKDRLEGRIEYSTNKDKIKLIGKRAPMLNPKSSYVWGSPIKLLDNDLSQWRYNEKDSLWHLKDGILGHQGVGSNLITKDRFGDFKLHVEFRLLSKGANSGIYLRGRYEVQVMDSYGMQPESHGIGGVYGFITPRLNAGKMIGEWQVYDITLTGRFITVLLNGVEVINNQPIPGITGGALDSDEGLPGPIKIQGDEGGGFEYRNIIITPALNS